MNCETFTSLSDLHREGGLTPGRAAQAQAHLEACPACTKAWSARPEAGAPAGLPDDLRRELTELGSEETLTHLPKSWPIPARSSASIFLIGAAICVCLAFLILLLAPAIPPLSLAALPEHWSVYER